MREIQDQGGLTGPPDTRRYRSRPLEPAPASRDARPGERSRRSRSRREATGGARADRRVTRRRGRGADHWASLARPVSSPGGGATSRRGNSDSSVSAVRAGRSACRRTVDAACSTQTDRVGRDYRALLTRTVPGRRRPRPRPGRRHRAAGQRGRGSCRYAARQRWRSPAGPAPADSGRRRATTRLRPTNAIGARRYHMPSSPIVSAIQIPPPVGGSWPAARCDAFSVAGQRRAAIRVPRRDDGQQARIMRREVSMHRGHQELPRPDGCWRRARPDGRPRP